MLTIPVASVARYLIAILEAKGTPSHIASVVADSLVLSNRRGHDSHGFIRIAAYCQWVDNGWVMPASEPVLVERNPYTLQVDGHFGFGQYVGRVAMDRALAMARGGHCVVTIKRSGHLGRVGELVEQVAAAGLVAIGFTNTHGGGLVAAPFGGAERRLSANPVVGGAPLPDQSAPMMMDISTSAIAAGKVRVAAARGDPLPDGCLVDGKGRPSTDPNDYDASPGGALLPFGDHKGYCLAMFSDVLAGALSGAGCSTVGVERVANGFFAVVVDPAAFCGNEFFDTEVGALVPHVKSSRLMEGHDEILYPGELEGRYQAERETHLEIEEPTWQEAAAVAVELGVSVPPVNNTRA